MPVVGDKVRVRVVEPARFCKDAWWTVMIEHDDARALLRAPDDPTLRHELEPGDTLDVWILEDGSCGSYSVTADFEEWMGRAPGLPPHRIPSNNWQRKQLFDKWNRQHVSKRDQNKRREQTKEGQNKRRRRRPRRVLQKA